MTAPTEGRCNSFLQVKLGVPNRYSISPVCLDLNIGKLATVMYVPQGGYKDIMFSGAMRELTGKFSCIPVCLAVKRFLVESRDRVLGLLWP